MTDSKKPESLMTLAEIHASGGEPFKTDFLTKSGKTIDEALEAFGHCTPAEFKKLIYLHTMPTDGDKVFTNPNLVQGAATIKGAKPGSVEEAVVRKSLETADKQRRFLTAALSVSDTPEVVHEWQRSGSPGVSTMAPSPPPVAAALSEPAAPVVPARSPAPVTSVTAVGQPKATADVQFAELSKWCTSWAKSSSQRRVSKSFYIDKEANELTDLLAERMNKRGHDTTPSILMRRIVRLGLIELLKSEEGGTKNGE